MVGSGRHSDKPLDLGITQLYGVQGVVSYKALAGAGADATLAAYNDQCVQSMAQGNSHASQDLDWRAIYMQFTRDHVLGTVPYRWESSSEAALVTVTFHSALDIVVVGGAFAYDGSVTGAEKATAVKAFLGIDADAPLMHALGEMKKLALVRETEFEWELVVPHNFLKSGLLCSERKVALFRRHRHMPVTDRWCSDPLNMDDDSKWERWNEGLKPSSIPDLPTPRFQG